MVMVMVKVMVMVNDDPCKNALTAPEPLLASARSFSKFPQYWYRKTHKNIF